MNPLGAGRYGWFVVIVGVFVLVYVTVNGVGRDGPGVQGLQAGDRLPPFAALLASADVRCEEDSDPCDANVARRPGDDDQAGPRPACRVRGPRILNICELAERGPVVLAFVVTRGDCGPQIDVLDDVRRRHPGVQVAAVGVRGDRDDLRELVRERGWRFPVAWDRDGTVASLYGVATCPQIVFARWRGEASGTAFSELGAGEVDRRVRRIVSASRRAGWEQPER